MIADRPNLEIERKKQLNIRLSEQEFKDLEFVMEKYKLNKVDAIVKAIKMLKVFKPKRYKNLHKKTVKTPSGEIDADILEFLEPSGLFFLKKFSIKNL